MFRNLLLRDVEDADLDKLITTGEDGTGNAKALERADADKLHQAKMLQLKLRMQKEVEQLREEHLMKLKHMTKILELELEQTEEMQTLSAEQKIQELEMEVEQRKEMEAEEDQIAQQRAGLKAFHTQRALQAKAARTVAHQRSEARQLTRQQKIAAKQREKQFYAQEEALRESLRAMAEDEDDESAEGDANDRKLQRIGSARQSVTGMSEISATDQSEISDMTTDTNAETTLDDEEAAGAGLLAENVEMEEEIRKERSRIEQLTKRHLEATETLRIQQREMRETLKRDHQQQMNRLLGEQEVCNRVLLAS